MKDSGFDKIDLQQTLGLFTLCIEGWVSYSEEASQDLVLQAARALFLAVSCRCVRAAAELGASIDLFGTCEPPDGKADACA